MHTTEQSTDESPTYISANKLSKNRKINIEDAKMTVHTVHGELLTDEFALPLQQVQPTIERNPNSPDVEITPETALQYLTPHQAKQIFNDNTNTTTSTPPPVTIAPITGFTTPVEIHDSYAIDNLSRNQTNQTGPGWDDLQFVKVMGLQPPYSRKKDGHTINVPGYAKVVNILLEQTNIKLKHLALRIKATNLTQAQLDTHKLEMQLAEEIILTYDGPAFTEKGKQIQIEIESRKLEQARSIVLSPTTLTSKSSTPSHTAPAADEITSQDAATRTANESVRLQLEKENEQHRSSFNDTDFTKGSVYFKIKNHKGQPVQPPTLVTVTDYSNMDKISVVNGTAGKHSTVTVDQLRRLSDLASSATKSEADRKVLKTAMTKYVEQLHVANTTLTLFHHQTGGMGYDMMKLHFLQNLIPTLKFFPPRQLAINCESCPAAAQKKHTSHHGHSASKKTLATKSTIATITNPKQCNEPLFSPLQLETAKQDDHEWFDNHEHFEDVQGLLENNASAYQSATIAANSVFENLPKPDSSPTTTPTTTTTTKTLTWASDTNFNSSKNKLKTTPSPSTLPTPPPPPTPARRGSTPRKVQGNRTAHDKSASTLEIRATPAMDNESLPNLGKTSASHDIWNAGQNPKSNSEDEDNNNDDDNDFVINDVSRDTVMSIFVGNNQDVVIIDHAQFTSKRVTSNSATAAARALHTYRLLIRSQNGTLTDVRTDSQSGFDTIYYASAQEKDIRVTFSARDAPHRNVCEHVIRELKRMARHMVDHARRNIKTAADLTTNFVERKSIYIAAFKHAATIWNNTFHHQQLNSETPRTPAEAANMPQVPIHLTPPFLSPLNPPTAYLSKLPLTKSEPRAVPGGYFKGLDTIKRGNDCYLVFFNRKGNKPSASTRKLTDPGFVDFHFHSTLKNILKREAVMASTPQTIELLQAAITTSTLDADLKASYLEAAEDARVLFTTNDFSTIAAIRVAEMTDPRDKEDDYMSPLLDKLAADRYEGDPLHSRVATEIAAAHVLDQNSNNTANIAATSTTQHSPTETKNSTTTKSNYFHTVHQDNTPVHPKYDPLETLLVNAENQNITYGGRMSFEEIQDRYSIDSTGYLTREQHEANLEPIYAPRTNPHTNKIAPILHISKPELPASITNSLIEEVSTPKNHRQAMIDELAEHWATAEDHEIDKMQNGFDNGIPAWKLISKSKMIEICQSENVEPIRSMWVYKVKSDANGKIKELKARVTQCGNGDAFIQNRDAGFAPVCKSSTVRAMLSECGDRFKFETMDAPLAYLNAYANRAIIVHQPPGHIVKDENGDEMYMLLQRNLYGGRDSGRLWADNLTRFLKKHKLIQSNHDPCFYYNKERTLFLCVYVDDCLLATCNELHRRGLIKPLIDEYGIKLEGDLHKGTFIGNEYEYIPHQGWHITNTNFIRRLAKSTGLQDSNPVNTPYYNKANIEPASHCLSDKEYSELIDKTGIDIKRLVGSLLFVTTNTRPGVSLAVGRIARWVDRPTENVINHAKHVVKYLHSTAREGLLIRPANNQPTVCWVDASYMGDRQLHGHPRYGYLLQVNGSTLVWRTSFVSHSCLSTCEAEYCALALAGKEAIHLQQIQSEFRNLEKVYDLLLNGDLAKEENPDAPYNPDTNTINNNNNNNNNNSDKTPESGKLTDPERERLLKLATTIQVSIREDNQPAVNAVKSSHTAYLRLRHTAAQYHFIRELHEKGVVSVTHTPATNMKADFLTKTTMPTKEFRTLDKTFTKLTP